MRVLFDQGTPVPLRQPLQGQHDVSTAYELGWSTLANGELIATESILHAINAATPGSYIQIDIPR